MQHSPPQSVLRTVTATRYLSAFRTGSSVPILVEADDDGVYVLKLRGAGQGLQALIAELVAGAIGRVLELPVYLIDHGAALSFQYNWTAAPDVAGPDVEQHVLWPFAGDLRAAVRIFRLLDDRALAAIVAAIPDAWLTGEPRFSRPDEYRAAYVEFFSRRRDAVAAFVHAQSQ
jgi:hypothetical protein